MYTTTDIFQDTGVGFVSEPVHDEVGWVDYFKGDKWAGSVDSSQGNKWVVELQSILSGDDLTKQCNVDACDIDMDTTLMWPVVIADEFNAVDESQKRVIMAREQMEYEAMYGTDTDVIDLLCHETIVDIRMGLWSADRYLALRARVYEYFELYNSGWFHEAVALANQLIVDHESHGEKCDPQIEEIWRKSLMFIQKNCGNEAPWDGVVRDVE
jgi:hypothetical protein